jgi:hypothetical protein
MKKHSRLLSHRLRRRHGDSRELAEQLAPLEELLPTESAKPANHSDNSQLVAQENGAIVVGRNKLTLPEDVVDVTDRKLILGLEPVVLVIAVLFLTFIVFIAWQVSRMAAPTN